MKNLMVLLSFIAFSITLNSQDLLEIYKSGNVHLVPDAQYAKGNDWNKVFETYYDTLYGRSMANRKSIVLLPDGSIIVNHAYRNFYTLFNPQGKFEREFGITGSDGRRFKRTKRIEGVLDGEILFTSLDNTGRMLCADLNGKYLKTLKLDYMSKGMVPLPGKKIAVVGWVIWETKIRDFVAIVDYETNEENIIWDHFTDRCDLRTHCKSFHYSYEFQNGTIISVSSMPFTSATGLSVPPRVERVDDHLIVSIPSTGEIFVYDFEGSLKTKKKIDWAAGSIPVAEQKEIQKKFISKYENLQKESLIAFASEEEGTKAKQTLLDDMKKDLESIDKPITIPYFSNIIKDSDGNLLFFEFPKDEGANMFNVWVFRDNGNFVCQSSFKCDDYDLVISPSKMVFHNGYLYGLQELKNEDGMPLRLVRFKLTAVN